MKEPARGVCSKFCVGPFDPKKFAKKFRLVPSCTSWCLIPIYIIGGSVNDPAGRDVREIRIWTKQLESGHWLSLQTKKIKISLLERNTGVNRIWLNTAPNRTMATGFVFILREAGWNYLLYKNRANFLWKHSLRVWEKMMLSLNSRKVFIDYHRIKPLCNFSSITDRTLLIFIS